MAPRGSGGSAALLSSSLSLSLAEQGGSAQGPVQVSPHAAQGHLSDSPTLGGRIVPEGQEHALAQGRLRNSRTSPRRSAHLPPENRFDAPCPTMLAHAPYLWALCVQNVRTEQTYVAAVAAAQRGAASVVSRQPRMRRGRRAALVSERVPTASPAPDLQPRTACDFVCS